MRLYDEMQIEYQKSRIALNISLQVQSVQTNSQARHMARSKECDIDGPQPVLISIETTSRPKCQTTSKTSKKDWKLAWMTW